MKKYDYALLIGRFQPFHAGHRALFDHAADVANHVIVVVGSYRVSRSLRNPFSSDEREAFIRGSLHEYSPERYSIVHLRDSAYNVTDWCVRLRREVGRIAGGGSVAIVGHYRDDSSFYLDHFPGWGLEMLGEQCGGISSTGIRAALFSGKDEELLLGCDFSVCAALAGWKRSEVYSKLREEFNFVEEYKAQWKNTPYPPVFVTTDAVCLALGHVLMIRRNGLPGKGQLALPGGFINQYEPIEKACVRELAEETAIEISEGVLRKSIRMNHLFDAPWRDPRARMITKAYLFDLDVSVLPAVRGGDDAAEAFWINLADIDDLSEKIFCDHWQIINYFINHL